MAALSLTRVLITHMHAPESDPICSWRCFAKEEEEVVKRDHRDHEGSFGCQSGGMRKGDKNLSRYAKPDNALGTRWLYRDAMGKEPFLMCYHLYIYIYIQVSPER